MSTWAYTQITALIAGCEVDVCVHGLQKCGPCGVDYEETNGRLIEEANADRLVEGDEDVSAADAMCKANE